MPLMIRALLAGLFCLAALTGAAAHPHVFVDARTAIVYDGSGAITAVRQTWTFDEMFSTFAVQGLPQTDGGYSRDTLAPLAKVNVESLAEFAYFSFGKANGQKLAFGEPGDYWLSFADKRLTLHFTLPLKQATPARNLTIELYDPTFYVDFTFAADTPVKLEGADAGCKLTVRSSAAASQAARSQTLSESFFASLNAQSDYGARFANRAMVFCP
jgi:ABC-type uncharacterized transport system substrate-binding protein